MRCHRLFRRVGRAGIGVLATALLLATARRLSVWQTRAVTRRATSGWGNITTSLADLDAATQDAGAARARPAGGRHGGGGDEQGLLGKVLGQLSSLKGEVTQLKESLRAAEAARHTVALGAAEALHEYDRRPSHPAYRQCRPEGSMIQNLALAQEVPTSLLFPRMAGMGPEIQPGNTDDPQQPMVNLALGRGRWTRHSEETQPWASASRAVDGSLDSPGCSMALPKAGEGFAWWQVDLETPRLVQRVEVVPMPTYERTRDERLFPKSADKLVWRRASGVSVAQEFHLIMGIEHGKTLRWVNCGTATGPSAIKVTASACQGLQPRVIKLKAVVRNAVLGLCEVRVFGPPHWMDAAVQLDGSGQLWKSLLPDRPESHCDLATGTWVPDKQREIPAGYMCGCVTDKHAHCGFSYLNYTKFTWQPSMCSIPPFSAERFVSLFKATTVNLVGDSLMRGMSNSLGCMLHVHQDEFFNAILPAGEKIQPGNQMYQAHTSGTVNVTWTLSNYLVEEHEPGFIESWEMGPIVSPPLPQSTWWPPSKPNTVTVLHTGRWWEPARWGEPNTQDWFNHQRHFWFTPPNCSRTGNCAPLGTKGGMGKKFHEVLTALVGIIETSLSTLPQASKKATWKEYPNSFLSGCTRADKCRLYNSKVEAQTVCEKAINDGIRCSGVVGSGGRWQTRLNNDVLPSSSAETALLMTKPLPGYMPESLYWMPFIPGCAHACHDLPSKPAANDWTSRATRTCEVSWNESIAPPCARCSFLDSMAAAAERTAQVVSGGLLNFTLLTRLRGDAFSCVVAQHATNEPGIHAKRDKYLLNAQPHWPQCLAVDGAHPTVMAGIMDTWNQIFVIKRARELAARGTI